VTTSSGSVARSQTSANLENEVIGNELGCRYDGSPAICHEPNGRAPRQTMHAYTPSTWLGRPTARAWTFRTDAILDFFGRGFTLLRFADRDVSALLEAAERPDVPREVVDVRDAQASALYERDLVLIGPDQHRDPDGARWCGEIRTKEIRA
jgi:hypothetical protein